MKHESAVMEQGIGLRTEAYWMPFTHNRYLKKHPRSRILARAEGAYYTSAEGKRLFDCISGMWCCPLGHGHPKIAEAVARQVKELDYSPAFQMGHPKIFSLAERIVQLAPAGRAQDRGRVSPHEGRCRAHAPDRPRARLSRRGHRRDFGRRHRAQPQDVRAAPPGGRRSPAAHLQRRRDGVFARPAQVGRAPGRRARAPGRAARCFDDRGGDRRADAGLGRRDRAACGLSRAAARDLRQARHPAHLRRGDHRLRAPGRALRRAAFRRHARHDHLRQDRHQRRHPHGRPRSTTLL